MKTCSKCKIQKDYSCFDKKSSAKDGHRSRCKDCRSSIYLNKRFVYRCNKYNIDHRLLELFMNSLTPPSNPRAIRQNIIKNGNSYLDYIPYRICELKKHIENQFEDWMNWDNWGKYNPKTWDDNDKSTWKWQLDHIILQSSFKYSSMEDEEFKKCWSLNNLRPYSAKQNILDGNRR